MTVSLHHFQSYVKAPVKPALTAADRSRLELADAYYADSGGR